MFSNSLELKKEALCYGISTLRYLYVWIVEIQLSYIQQ